MKSFVLVLTVTIDFKKTKLELEWKSENGKMLSDAPKELNDTIAELKADCTYALPILSPLFERFSKNKAPVTASASVTFEGENEDWQLAFLAPQETEENKYIRALLFRLLTDRKAFLREVKRLEKKLY